MESEWRRTQAYWGVDVDDAQVAREADRDAVADVKVHCSTYVSLFDRGLDIEVDCCA
jgi:hypothetical protein